MQSHTEQIAISATAVHVFAYVADPTKLPLWATGFAKSVRSEGDDWFVENAQGEIGLRIDSHADTGVVDYVMIMGPGVEATASSRVVGHGDHSVYVFTAVQDPGMPDETFEAQIQSLREELPQLKNQLEAS